MRTSAATSARRVGDAVIDFGKQHFGAVARLAHLALGLALAPGAAAAVSMACSMALLESSRKSSPTVLST